jgi:hypothetical protein
MEAVIDLLLDWIADNSTYKTTDMVHPAILELSAEELTREYYTGVPHLMPDDGVDERVNALYAPGDGTHGTIYILAPDLAEGAQDFENLRDNPLWQEILLHELVHHAQHQSGIAEGWACPSLGETEAYRLGGRYLRQRHVTDPMPNRSFWGAIYGRC